MLETYFVAPKMVAHLRAGPSGPYMDGFAAWLTRDRYAAFRRGALSARGGAHRALYPGAGRNICQPGFGGLFTSFANVPLPAVKRRPAQPPHDFRRQALPRIP